MRDQSLGSRLPKSLALAADAANRDGAIAQLGERLHGMQEVSGSIPLGSTTFSCAPPSPANPARGFRFEDCPLTSTILSFTAHSHALIASAWAPSSGQRALIAARAFGW